MFIFSIQGYDFCYKHYKSYATNKKDKKLHDDFESLLKKITETEMSEESASDINMLSEQKFLYHDLMRKNDFLNGIDNDQDG